MQHGTFAVAIKICEPKILKSLLFYYELITIGFYFLSKNSTKLMDWFCKNLMYDYTFL